MATENINLCIDRDIKEQAEAFFGELGMTMATAFNVFVRQSLRQGKIPFEISLSDIPDRYGAGYEITPEQEKNLLLAVKEAKAGDAAGPFNLEDGIKYLEGLK